MTWVQTHSGVAFDLLEPRSEDVRIEDIAHHLSRIARYSGATQGLHAYSVAQHSVLCADIVEAWGGPVWLQREALLHDAGEAYYGDITSPVQLALRAVAAQVVEAWVARISISPAPAGYGHGMLDAAKIDPLAELKRRVDGVVRRALDLAFVEPGAVRHADRVALATERKLLMAPCAREWPLIERADERWAVLEVLDADSAEQRFLWRLRDLDTALACDRPTTREAT